MFYRGNKMHPFLIVCYKGKLYQSHQCLQESSKQFINHPLFNYEKDLLYLILRVSNGSYSYLLHSNYIDPPTFQLYLPWSLVLG